MAENETNDRSSDPDSEYEYGGGTGDFERGEYNPGEGGLEDTDFEDDGVLDSSDTLEDPEDPVRGPAGHRHPARGQVVSRASGSATRWKRNAKASRWTSCSPKRNPT